AKQRMDKKEYGATQNGQLGVNLSLQNCTLRNQAQVGQSAIRKALGRTLIEIGGVWIDEGFDAKMKTITVKAMSKAYFKLLQRQPQVRDVLAVGNHLVWITPSATALIIDTTDGVEELANEDIDRLFVPRKRRV